MFSDLGSIRSAVKDRLEPLMPPAWKFDEYVTESVQPSLVPFVWLEFVGIESAPEGQPLGRGQAGARFNIVVADARTGETGEDNVDDHALLIVSAIEHMDDLFWSNATKTRLEDGRIAWRIDALALTLTPAPEPQE